MCDGKVVLLGDRDVDHYPLQDDDGICLMNPFGQQQEFFQAKEGLWPHVCACVSVCVQAAVI